jgi:hypothetical protein
MADSLPVANTLTPSDSVSVAIEPTKTTAPSKGRAGGTRSAKNAIAKDTPPGAVKVEPPGSKKSTKTSVPRDATIPLTGWADLDISAARVETIPTFTVDVNPFLDLVSTEFSRIVSRSSLGKHLPFALFQYYCLQLFWYRVLFLMKSNGQTLSSDQKNFLNAFVSGDAFVVPPHIAQYLANLGNFMQGGENFYFRLLDAQFTGVNKDHSVSKGWLDTGNGATQITTGNQFWIYAQLPVPAVMVTTVMNEVAFNDPSNPGLLGLAHVTPPAADGFQWNPTNNIAGFLTDESLYRYNHSSHRSTYTNLGWTDTAAPTDMQTCYLFSASSMRWLSDKLSDFRDLKVHPSTQLGLSVNGSPMQAYWLEEPDRFQSYDDPDLISDSPRSRATAVTDLALVSRFSVDPKALTPSFDFGYRLARSKVITGYANKLPVFAARSNFQPWIYRTDSGVVSDPPDLFLNGMNATWSFGSQSNLNIVRFATPVLRRDLALQSSLLLVT